MRPSGRPWRPTSPRTASTDAPSQRLERHDHGSGAVALPGLGTTDHRGGPEDPRGPGRPVPATLHPAASHPAVDLTVPQRELLGHWLRSGWPPGAKPLYAALSGAVARASVSHWEEAMDERGGTGEAMLWRLLRIGSAPYFVLGSSADRSLRLRIATSWDWRQHFQLVALAMEGQSGGQPRVGWEALVRDRTSNEVRSVVGHIEVRWRTRPLRWAARGQGLPRHIASSRAWLLHPAMSVFDPSTFTPPLLRPGLVSSPVVLRPYVLSDLALVRQASADAFIPSISSVPPRYTDGTAHRLHRTPARS